MGSRTTGSTTPPVSRNTLKPMAKSTMETIGLFHEEELAQLLQRLGRYLDAYRTGDLDPWDMDHVLHHYSLAAKELWTFCNTGSRSLTADLIREDVHTDWWARTTPRHCKRDGCILWPRAFLRPMEPADAEVIAAWGDDLLFCDEAGWSRDLDPAERRQRWGELVADPPSDLIRLTAVSDGEVVGYVDFHGDEPKRRELGYIVGGRERWGRGLGTALARAGLDHGFDVLGLDEIWAEAADANPVSVRILQRIGMTETGRGEDTLYLDRPTFYRQFAITRGR